jgi:hypothetical protein
MTPVQRPGAAAFHARRFAVPHKFENRRFMRSVCEIMGILVTDQVKYVCV